MKLLFYAALKNRKHLILFLFSLIALIFLTFSTFLEISALGILTNVETLTQLSSNSSLDFSHAASPLLKVQKNSNVLSIIYNYLSQSFPHIKGLTLLVSILIVVGLFKAISLFWSRFMAQLLAIRVSKDLRQQYFEHIQSLSMSFYQKYNIGALSTRVVGDAGQVAFAINSALTNFIQTPLTVTLTLASCFYISWQLACLVFIGMPMLVFPVVILTRRVKKISRQLQVNQERFTSLLIDFLTGIHTIKIFAMEGFAFQKYSTQNNQIARLESKSAKYSLLTRPILHALMTFCISGTVLFGLYNLKLSLSELIVFCGLLQTSYESLKRFAEESTNIQRGIVAAERMYQVLELKSEIEDKKEAIILTEFLDSIEFDRVWFSYEGDWILKDVSFKIGKGETVAIVGPTGSGKSTIVQLLPRLYDVQRGEIRIDGKPLSAYTQKSVREQIAFVSQKPFLFYDTIAANISFGQHFESAEIESAAIKAHADEFILMQPKGYDTMLLEAGQNLSGGQQQRIAIARALVKKAPILVLDEATSSLDALSEAKIKDAIMNLHGEITQLIIAHRLGTIEHADRIIYLENGTKVGEGTKDELLQTCPQFKQAWDIAYQSSTSISSA